MTRGTFPHVLKAAEYLGPWGSLCRHCHEGQLKQIVRSLPAVAPGSKHKGPHVHFKALLNDQYYPQYSVIDDCLCSFY
jgi:hypothetical protein